jgi:putative flippase GtrA
MKKTERGRSVINGVKRLRKKSRIAILMSISGILTTLANMVTFVVCTHLFGDEHYVLNNVAAWFVCMVVAFVTNKLWVFSSKSWRLKIAGKEFMEFAFARLLSFAFEEIGLILFVNFSRFGQSTFSFFGYQMTSQVIIKLILSVGVVISNYLVSKYWVFKVNNEKT